MRHLTTVLGLILLLFFLTPFVRGENDSLSFFLGRVAPGTNELSKKEKTDLLVRINEVLEQASRTRGNLSQAIQTGDMEVGYREGKFWMTRLEEDRDSIQTGLEQLKLLKEKPGLVPSIKLFKALKDLSRNFNTYNNTAFLSGFVGDIAPELELWADPVFYRLYLLPLAKSKDGATKLLPKEKSPPKEKRM